MHKSLDSVFRKVRTANIGTNIKHTEPFSDEEDQLWSTGVLGINSPKTLLNAVFFISIGRTFVSEEVKNPPLGPVRYQVSGIRYHYLTWEAVSHWLLQGLPQKKNRTKQNE